jgi:uncharacterized protein YkwD
MEVQEVMMKILLLMALITLGGCAKESDSKKETKEQTQEEIISDILSVNEEKMFHLVNSHRASKNLPLYSLHTEATFQSQGHASYMAHTTRGLTHSGFKARGQKVRDSEQRTVSRSGENVAYNSTTEKAHKALLQSRGHRKNIEGDFTHMGIGIERDNTGRLYVTQFFIKIKE